MSIVSRIRRVLINFLPDELYLKLVYYRIFKKKLNLSRPELFCEKLQWIKLNDRKEIYHRMVDKYEAKKFIAERVGEQYIIPTLGLWDKFEEIDFDLLPDKFVLKCTHDSGSYYLCEDKSKLDKEILKKKLLKNFGMDYFYISREWPYKGLKYRIIAEPLLGDQKSLREYKFFCFNGVPKIYQSCTDRDNSIGGAILQFFDIEGNLLEIEDAHHHRKSSTVTAVPIHLDEMLRISEILSKDTYCLRVDFFEVDSKLYLGEMTFFESSGFCEFVPEKYNRILGDWIQLPMDQKGF